MTFTIVLDDICLIGTTSNWDNGGNMTYCEFVKNYMNVSECMDNNKYSSVGKSFYKNSKYYKGIYWFYQTDNYIIDIHDFYIKEELVQENVYNMSEYMSIYTSYLISANGEKFTPYQTLTSNSLYTLDFDNIEKNFRFLLHENSYYLGVAIGFRKEFINKHLKNLNIDYNSFYSDLFLSNETILTKSLEPIALDILNCNMNSPAAEFFFDAKVSEWISVIIDTFLKRKNFIISQDDDISLINVQKYLDDHFAIDVNQKTLEKISMMSGTKLKKLFKEKYGQTITEYTQRKRMNIAEVLLIKTNLPIKEIAISVGYSSHSKFSSYYKRYKGVFPSDVRKLCKENKNFLESDECF